MQVANTSSPFWHTSFLLPLLWNPMSSSNLIPPCTLECIQATQRSCSGDASAFCGVCMRPETMAHPLPAENRIAPHWPPPEGRPAGRGGRQSRRLPLVVQLSHPEWGEGGGRKAEATRHGQPNPEISSGPLGKDAGGLLATNIVAALSEFCDRWMKGWGAAGQG